jgi:hypothetical protein
MEEKWKIEIRSDDDDDTKRNTKDQGQAWRGDEGVFIWEGHAQRDMALWHFRKGINKGQKAKRPNKFS